METLKGKENQENAGLLNRSITRRQAIMAGGIAVVGLAFSKPLIETVMPKPAFANYTPVVGGQPSIEWGCSQAGTASSLGVVKCDGEDDVEVTGIPLGTTQIDVTVRLCNASGQAIGFDSLVTLIGVLTPGSFSDANFINSSFPSSVGPFGSPGTCIPVTFTINLYGTNENTKLRFKATPDTPPAPNHGGGWLNITLKFG